jgi:signal transduction histidine kinase
LQNNSGHDHPEILIEENLFNSSVVSNLLSNAIKFSPEGSEIEIKIELLPATDSSTRLALTIADNGVGLPPEMREKFNLGQNVQSRVGTSGEQGTGFGLDIARAIVKSMNGELMIKSQTAAESPNEHGTSVTLVFPFAATSH